MTDQFTHMLLYSRPNEGKSTFLSTMTPEFLIVDADARWSDQNVRGAHLIRAADPLEILTDMEAKRPSLKGKVGTVGFDSGTAIMDYLGAVGRLREERARADNQKFNVNDLHRTKADTMRALRLAALKWHCNVVWVFHIEDGKLSGKDKERVTISSTEQERMKSNLNVICSIVRDQKTAMRGLRIEWSRYHNGAAIGQVVWDFNGMWLGVADKLALFIRNFDKSQGYTGKAYSTNWLKSYLEGKEIAFADELEMLTKLDVKQPPMWFDRNAWLKLLEKAGVPA